MNTRAVIGISVFIILTTAYLQAAVIPGHWEKVEALEEGYPIVVTMEGWERIKGTFLSVDEESLTMVKNDGKDLNLPKADVRKVESQDKPNNDNLLNGPMWGGDPGWWTISAWHGYKPR
jgi:hypothetical protein